MSDSEAGGDELVGDPRVVVLLSLVVAAVPLLEVCSTLGSYVHTYDMFQAKHLV